MWPYDVNPQTYVDQALTPMAPRSYAPLPSMTPASYHGPTHQALSESLRAALGQQAGVPGLLSSMMADPALARQTGGFGLLNFTPPAPTPYHYTPPPEPVAPAPVAAPATAAPTYFYGPDSSQGDGGEGW